jgi:16S rRNA (cytosine1402-N4)-methyltransferase
MSLDPQIYAASGGHAPVMLRDVVGAMALRDGDMVVDATFGGGGYSRAFLDVAGCTVFGIDRDAQAIERGEALAASYGGRLHLIPGTFDSMVEALAGAGVLSVNAIAFDLGVSSYQIDQAERGFSFMKDGPLDMRMGAHGPTAAELVNTAEVQDLAHIIWSLGEERQSRRIARAIVEARGQAPIETTGQLAAVIEKAVGRRPGDKIHPATRTFQGLRIHVNDELGQIERGLVAAERLLAPDGRLVVVSYQSLEDRIVKRFLRERSGEAAAPSRHMPDAPGRGAAPTFRLMHRKAVRPGDDETAVNPRARSARLRAAWRTEAPAWDKEVAA